ncbi:MAG: TolC family protein [Steroidobacteraceae bacterium]
MAMAVGAAAAARAGDDTEPAGRPLGTVVDDYVRAGLAANLALADQSLEVERSLAALDAARARFLPEVALAARYTRADGGRQFTVPVAQLLNPAYQTLNELLVAGGGTPRFPPLTDQSFPLQLPREQDTRVTLRQPLYAPAIPAGAAAARAGLRAAGYGREALARALRRDITVAYLDWLKAGAGERIVAASHELLAENLRVNEVLYANGKVTEDQVLRARAELLGVQQQQLEAANAMVQAASYLNFLLNRPLATPLEAAAIDAPALAPALAASAAPELATATATAREARPELRQLEQAGVAASAQLRAARAAWRPNLALGVDAGSEGADYGFGREYNFVSASLVFNWTLFDGGARSAAVAQARVASRRAENQRVATTQRVELEVQQALDSLRTARLSLDAAGTRADAARAAFRIASRRRDAGMLPQVEFLDARSALTGAELNLNQTRFDLLQRHAALEYALAAGELPPAGVLP